MKKSVLTYVMGENDKLLEPICDTTDWDLVCFTNRKDIKSENWNVVFVEDKEERYNNKRFANLFKFNPFEMLFKALEVNYDICITVDANIRIQKNLDKIISYYCHPLYDITLAKHPIRNCVIAEAEAIVGEKKDTKEAVSQNIKLYHKENYPLKNGMYQTTVMIWKNTNATHTLSLAFTELYHNLSERDQLLLPYILWKCPEIDIIETDWEDFEAEFDYEKHDSEK